MRLRPEKRNSIFGAKVRSAKRGRGFSCPMESISPRWGITTPLCPVASTSLRRTGPYQGANFGACHRVTRLPVTAIRPPNSTSVLCLVTAPLDCMCMAHRNFSPLLVFPLPRPPDRTTDDWTLTLLQGSRSEHHPAKHRHPRVPTAKVRRR